MNTVITEVDSGNMSREKLTLTEPQRKHPLTCKFIDDFLFKIQFKAQPCAAGGQEASCRVKDDLDAWLLETAINIQNLEPQRLRTMPGVGIVSGQVKNGKTLNIIKN